jgi:hypothetical protein
LSLYDLLEFNINPFFSECEAGGQAFIITTVFITQIHTLSSLTHSLTRTARHHGHLTPKLPSRTCHQLQHLPFSSYSHPESLLSGMDTSPCDGIKFQYDVCINDKLAAMKNQKPDVDCEEVFEQWRDCYSSAVKAFIAKSKEKKGK